MELALTILRASSREFSSASLQTPTYQLALRVLLPYADRHTLLTLWGLADNSNPMQRRHNMARVIDTVEASILRRHFTR